MKYLAVVLSSLISLGCGQVLDLNAYPFSAVLNADASGNARYTLYWNFSASDETITFAVNVSTNGWVGLGISPNGDMTDSDIVIGWVNDMDEVIFHDRYADAQTLPPIDPQQDWTILRGDNIDGYTVLEFSRKWVTCDDRDNDILADTSRVVYAWNDNDPADDSSPMYHGVNRGAVSLNLLSGVTNPPTPDQNSVQSFTISVENVPIPGDDDTTYWCAALELPAEIQQQKQYIIRYSPRITPNEFQYVHHMLIYLCNSLNVSTEGNGAICAASDGTTVSECRQGSLIAGWAVGGTDFIYPDNVAYPLGGADSPRYVVIEMHYDNPNLNSGIIDSSGIEFFYTSEPREHEAGILNLGHAVTRFMILPPLTERYDIVGKCAAECTSQFLPEEGINIFGNLLHTHLLGRGLTLKVIRNTQTCDGLEELKPIDQNLQYDFNFQQFTVLPNEVKVYPGDILLLECNYNTSEVSGVTLGGEATREEMCLAFPVYYPRSPLSSCVSTPGETAFNQFGASYFDFENLGLLLEALINGTQSEAEEALNQYVNWSPAAASALQTSVLDGDLNTFCVTDQSDVVFTYQEKLPTIACEYEAPDVCAAGATVLIGNMMTLFVFLALTVLLL